MSIGLVARILLISPVHTCRFNSNISLGKVIKENSSVEHVLSAVNDLMNGYAPSSSCKVASAARE